METVTILGDNDPCGAYLLRMRIESDTVVRFGRFQGGRPIIVPQGEAVYVGSAMGQQGSTTLARRLLRHATRCDKEKPQAIRREMLAAFADAGLGITQLEPPVIKRLFWNVDYLLEKDIVDLSHVVAIRTRIKIEDDLAQMLEAEPKSHVLAQGLGAHDKRGRTHLLMIEGTADWWQKLLERLQRMLKYGMTLDTQSNLRNETNCVEYVK